MLHTFVTYTLFLGLCYMYTRGEGHIWCHSRPGGGYESGVVVLPRAGCQAGAVLPKAGRQVGAVHPEVGHQAGAVLPGAGSQEPRLHEPLNPGWNPG